jgi:hypothetical protein
MAGCCCVGQHNKSISAEPRVNLNAARRDHPAVVHLLRLLVRAAIKTANDAVDPGLLPAHEIAGQPRPPGGFSFGC